MKTKYQIYNSTNDKWETALRAERAQPGPSGWLLYELRDGTPGLARPGTWREKTAGSRRERIDALRKAGGV